MWVCPYAICMCPVAFAVRAGCEVSIGPIFPLGVLAATTLVGGKAGDGGARARARCELGLFLSSMAIITLSGGWDWDPKS